VVILRHEFAHLSLNRRFLCSVRTECLVVDGHAALTWWSYKHVGGYNDLVYSLSLRLVYVLTWLVFPRLWMYIGYFDTSVESIDSW
jgi:hypothetical protein